MIVDDEPLARLRLRTLCDAMPDQAVIIGEVGDGREAMARIEVEQPDLLLLDIAMPDLNGMELAQMLAQSASSPTIIFCTAYPAHALEAFEVSAADYLLKPIERERLSQAFQKAALLRAGTQPISPAKRPWLDHLWVPNRDGMIRIELGDVERIEADGDYVRLSTARESHLLHEAINRLEERLDPARFVRVRRSVMVRVDLLKAVVHLGGGTWNVLLADDTRIRVGPTYWKMLKGRLRW
ncbi:LytTR family DNA-binding domain-containing protein [Sphingomonas sp. UYP23]